MIGADDFESFFDPDEFGCLVKILEPGRDPREVAGMLGAPELRERLYRSGTNASAAQQQVRVNALHLQLPRGELPADHKAVRIELDGQVYTINNREPIGRLRELLTLAPAGTRSAPVEERGRWRVPDSSSG